VEDTFVHLDGCLDSVPCPVPCPVAVAVAVGGPFASLLASGSPSSSATTQKVINTSLFRSPLTKYSDGATLIK
jgi:hypothetical protein